MNVLVVIGAYLPATAYGGPIVSVHDHLKAMAATGAKIRVLTTDANGTSRIPSGTAVIDGVEVRYFRATPLNRHGISAGLWREIGREVPRHDVIHAHGMTQVSTTVALWAARHAGKPIVVSARGALMTWGRSRKRVLKSLYWMLDALPARRACFLATSDLEARQMTGVGIREIATVANGVDAEAFAVPSGVDIRAHLGIIRQQPLVAWIGRFDPVKNVEAVLDATQGLGVDLLLGGDAGNQYGADMRARSRARDDVHFLGYVNGEVKRAMLQQSDAFVSASFMESYGMAIAEALAAGCPVVVSRGTPWSEVVDHGAGYWVDGTPDELRRALRQVLERGKGMREAARRLAERHSWKDRAKELLGLYERLIARGSTGDRT